MTTPPYAVPLSSPYDLLENAETSQEARRGRQVSWQEKTEKVCHPKTLAGKWAMERAFTLQALRWFAHQRVSERLQKREALDIVFANEFTCNLFLYLLMRHLFSYFWPPIPFQKAVNAILALKRMGVVFWSVTCHRQLERRLSKRPPTSQPEFFSYCYPLCSPLRSVSVLGISNGVVLYCCIPFFQRLLTCSLAPLPLSNHHIDPFPLADKWLSFNCVICVIFLLFSSLNDATSPFR